MPVVAAAEEAAVVEAAVAVPAEVVQAVEAQAAGAQAAVQAAGAQVVVLAVETAEAEAADRLMHSEARATRSRHRRNPLPASAPRVRTMRQEALPVGCSPHINACPRRRFRIPTGASISCLVPVKVWSQVSHQKAKVRGEEMDHHQRMRVALVAAGACIISWTSLAPAQTQQEHVHDSAHSVMPFDISKTLHIFRMTEQGGVQRVVIRDSSAKAQVPLIQQHLKHEAERFQDGNYSDPGALHGKEMPGLKELQAAKTRIAISYTARPDGAEITFSTEDRHLLTAIHRWFGAQLSEHGADARAE